VLEYSSLLNFKQTDLTVKRQLTICNGREVPDPKDVTVTSYLNFSQDLFTFEINVIGRNIIWTRKDIIFAVLKERKHTVQLTMRESQDKQVITLDANIKDVLLHLFRPVRKEFYLVIVYKKNFSEYSSSFVVVVPIIDDQK